MPYKKKRINSKTIQEDISRMKDYKDRLINWFMYGGIRKGKLKYKGKNRVVVNAQLRAESSKEIMIEINRVETWLSEMILIYGVE